MPIALPAAMDSSQPSFIPSVQPRLPEDADLMKAIVDRDCQALATLYDRYAPRVLAVCRRILHDASDAEEVMTEVFFEAWSRSDRFDGSRGSALVYLLTLARSRSIDRKRSLTSRKAGGNTANLPDFLGTAEQSTVEADPFRSAEADEQGNLIRKALQTLDINQREALQCSYFDGLTHTEIADKLNKPLGTVKTYIRQGLIRLREQLRNQA